MIGFRPNQADSSDSHVKSGESDLDFEKREMPADKPDREIILPTPSVVPAPGPDTITNSPSPEIRSIPADLPTTAPPPEISPADPVEFS